MLVIDGDTSLLRPVEDNDMIVTGDIISYDISKCSGEEVLLSFLIESVQLKV